MRQIMPSNSAIWRTIDNNVPEYIAVTHTIEVARQAGETTEAVRQIMNDLEIPTRDVAELVSNGMAIISNDPTYTVLDGRINIGPTLTTSSTTMMEMSMDEIDRARVAMEQLHTDGHIAQEETVDDSELAEEPVVRRRAPRRKKERPPFWKEETSGQTTTLPALIGQLSENLNNIQPNIRGTIHASSPYVKLIPIKVLSNHVDADHRRWTRYSQYSREANYNRNLGNGIETRRAMDISNLNIGLSQIVNNMIFNNRISDVSGRSFETVLKDATKFFIRDNNLININYTSDSASGFHYTRRAFHDGEAMRIHARTFAVSLGQLTCFLETEAYSRVYTPQVLAVILPENYVYQKWHILTHGTIDLSKVIVLVNRELDDTDFHHKNFRAYYRKYLLPVLNELKVEVWKVPVSFMEEYCFHNGITFEKTAFMERRQETETIFTSFRNQFTHYDLDPQPEDDGDDDDYDEDYDDDDDDY